ncbi:hypothetical protein BFP76_05020 [Amylibacter kogurei]|uniref:Uncharacterized protein n=1 Tax=Paramylibacter kogurei TaxID=1889778 RepID=A0A2G5K4U5_9RHOB|nr:hypothetical protein [Amylibacter kogurei]PIB24556.1 hypothetical protein BFP76_05020 [Amylibacter kogurei]
MEYELTFRITSLLRQTLLMCVISLLLLPQIVSAGVAQSSKFMVSDYLHCAETHHNAGNPSGDIGVQHNHSESDSCEIMGASTCSGVMAVQAVLEAQMQQLLAPAGLSFEITLYSSVNLDAFRKPPKAA